MVCLLSYHIEILSFDIAVFIVTTLFYKNWEVCGDCFTVYLVKDEIMDVVEAESATFSLLSLANAGQNVLIKYIPFCTPK